ncbi:ACT domain-containing protein [Anaerobiospirillum thomasii]|uniref:HAD family hydrolase n=1 Tax=Anaerobiospirillum thomasii TaxID=179995 RepID=UPI000D83A46B|nr:HAD-IB family hydrolase [Anaerobiospirillum thomasii]SPT71662.1 ACT domain-containing protein [Anaerobiospirillum thomasii]
MALALFDMDGTLIDGDTNNIFFHYMQDIGLVDEDFVKPLKYFHYLYFKGELKIEDFVNHSVKPLIGKSPQEIEDIVMPCIKERIVPKLKKGALEAIEFHRHRKDYLVLVSATVDYLARPLAQTVGISDVIASPIGFDEHGLTGRLTDTVPYQEGKRKRLLKFIEQHNISLDDSYGYGDSLNDIQMFEMVEHKYAVDADERFKEHPFYERTRHVSWL